MLTNADTSWSNNTRCVEQLSAAEIDVWLVEPETVTQLASRGWLSESERLRASRFRFDQHRCEFTAARNALRFLLGNYLHRGPGTIEITFTGRGKPEVTDQDSGLRFNIAHSGGYILLAFTCSQEIGADVEYINGEPIEPGMLDLCLHKSELLTFHSLPESDRAGFFYRCWSEKEAYLKLLGDGLAANPSEVELNRMKNTGEDDHGRKVQFTGVPMIPGCSAALATHFIPGHVNYHVLAGTLVK
jgi:4'-phosphopantetheinyl transferase